MRVAAVGMGVAAPWLWPPLDELLDLLSDEPDDEPDDEPMNRRSCDDPSWSPTMSPTNCWSPTTSEDVDVEVLLVPDDEVFPPRLSVL
jgi:hypothetical protein